MLTDSNTEVQWYYTLPYPPLIIIFKILLQSIISNSIYSIEFSEDKKWLSIKSVVVILIGKILLHSASIEDPNLKCKKQWTYYLDGAFW